MITPQTKSLGIGTYFHELLGHPEHLSRGCCLKFASCHLFPGHLREQSFFFMKTWRLPGFQLGSYVQPQKASSWARSSTVPSQKTGSPELGGPWVALLFFFFFKSIQWGVYWNSSVPFLLFVTNSHGSVFSVLFFFSVFKKKIPPREGVVQNWPFK